MRGGGIPVSRANAPKSSASVRFSPPRTYPAPGAALRGLGLLGPGGRHQNGAFFTVDRISGMKSCLRLSHSYSMFFAVRT